MTSYRESLDILQTTRKNFSKENNKCIHRALLIKVGGSLCADGGRKRRGNINSSLKVILKIEFLSNQDEDKKYQFIVEAYGGLSGEQEVPGN
jgi:hypothetical protein